MKAVRGGIGVGAITQGAEVAGNQTAGGGFGIAHQDGAQVAVRGVDESYRGRVVGDAERGPNGDEGGGVGRHGDRDFDDRAQSRGIANHAGGGDGGQGQRRGKARGGAAIEGAADRGGQVGGQQRNCGIGVVGDDDVVVQVGIGFDLEFKDERCHRVAGVGFVAESSHIPEDIGGGPFLVRR